VLPKPSRVHGQRRYSPDAIHWLALLQLAQSCGFRLDEMRRLLNGYAPSVPPSRRWDELAHKKLQEVEHRISQLQTMRNIIKRVRQCDCADLSQCGRMADSIMRLGNKQPRH
jgi:MerR family redox-sensitive transcriptional activator SoxR